MDAQEMAALMRQAEAYVEANLPALVRDVLTLQDAGMLDGGPLRVLRTMVDFSGSSALSLAESMVKVASLRKLHALFDVPPASESTMSARLRAAADRRLGGAANPLAEQDQRDGALMREAADALDHRGRLMALTPRSNPASPLRTTDPMEQRVEQALVDQGIDYLTDRGGENPADLDFLLPGLGLHIEVKRMHSPRIADQMVRVENVIVAQGEMAVNVLAHLIRTGKGMADAE